MYRFIFYMGLATMGILNYSCSEEIANSSNTIVHIPTQGETIDAKGKDIVLPYSMNPLELLLLKDYLVVLNLQDDSLCMVFNWPEMTLANVLGRKGRGPGEFVFPGLVEMSQGENEFAIQDMGKKEIYCYSLEDADHKTIKAQRTIGWYSEQLPNQLKIYPESYVYSVFNPLEVAAYKQVKVNDIPIEQRIYDLSTSFEEKGESGLYSGKLAHAHEKMAYAFRYKKQIALMHKEGLDIILDFPHDSPVLKAGFGVDNAQSVIHYISVTASDNLVYALDFGYTDAFAKAHRDEIRSGIDVVNWEGQFEKRINLDRFLRTIVVDEERGIIMGISSLSENALSMFEI